MTAISIRPVHELDCYELASRLRKADAEEAWASAEATPLEAVLRSWRGSVLSWSGFADGRLVCMWGVCPGPGYGVPWMLGTDEVVTYQKHFLRRNRSFVLRMHQEFDRLYNWVDARNVVAIRWLRWLGFTIEPAVSHGPLDLPFHLFWRVEA